MGHQAIINYSEAIKAIKSAILQSRYRAAALANGEMLSLYFGIGKYISENSRKGFWGTNAIEIISQHLQKELPGLRGFSATNMKNMRLFYEEWEKVINSAVATAEIQAPDLKCITNKSLPMVKLSNFTIQPIVDELNIDINLLMNINSTVVTAEFQQYFLHVGFTHHREILRSSTQLQERLFYIQKCATEFWSVEKLKYHL